MLPHLWTILWIMMHTPSSLYTAPLNKAPASPPICCCRLTQVITSSPTSSSKSAVHSTSPLVSPEETDNK